MIRKDYVIKGNTYSNLIQQVEKISKHNRQGSFKTKVRYEYAMKRFCEHLSDYKVQNIKNIQEKHLVSYVEDLLEAEASASYIKTDLSAIRFYHDKISHTKINELPTNEKLEIPDRSYSGINRKWSDQEVSRFKDLCIENDKEWIAQATDIARFAGFRIHEVTKIDKAQLEDALRNDRFVVKGKGGRVREVPLNDRLRATVEELNNNTERGHKVFVEDHQRTDTVISQIQKAVREYRSDFTDSDRDTDAPNLTFHGLRHSYAAEQYESLIEDECDVHTAEYKVSNLLGHSRTEITRLYLAK